MEAYDWLAFIQTAGVQLLNKVSAYNKFSSIIFLEINKQGNSLSNTLLHFTIIFTLFIFIKQILEYLLHYRRWQPFTKFESDRVRQNLENQTFIYFNIFR